MIRKLRFMHMQIQGGTTDGTDTKNQVHHSPPESITESTIISKNGLRVSRLRP